MVKRALVCVSNGVEETEAIVTISVLRKAGMEVTIVDCGGNGRETELVTGRERIRIMPDCQLDSRCANENWDVIVLPGGEKHAATCQQVSPSPVKIGLFSSRIDA